MTTDHSYCDSIHREMNVGVPKSGHRSHVAHFLTFPRGHTIFLRVDWAPVLMVSRSKENLVRRGLAAGG